MKGYYASIRNHSQTRHGFLAGPFEKHEMAMVMVDPAHFRAVHLNQTETAFAGFGTLSLDLDDVSIMPIGLLNSDLGVTLVDGWGQLPAGCVEIYQRFLDTLTLYPRQGSEAGDAYQLALARDARKVYEYEVLGWRTAGCSCYLTTPEMRTAYPHIDCQYKRKEVEDVD